MTDTVALIARTVCAAFAAAVAALLFFFWPESLGGHVAFVKVDGVSMLPTYRNGDLAVVRRQSHYRIGDPVAYRIPAGEFGAGALVIHRLKAGDDIHGFTTRGDNRNMDDPWHPRSRDIVGRVQFDLPGLGTRVGALTRPLYIGALVGGLTTLSMLFPSKRRTRVVATP